MPAPGIKTPGRRSPHLSRLLGIKKPARKGWHAKSDDFLSQLNSSLFERQGRAENAMIRIENEQVALFLQFGVVL